MRGFYGSDKWEKIGIIRNLEEWTSHYQQTVGWEGFPSGHSGTFPVLAYRLKCSYMAQDGKYSTEKQYCQYLFIEDEDIKQLLKTD